MSCFRIIYRRPALPGASRGINYFLHACDRDDAERRMLDLISQGRYERVEMETDHPCQWAEKRERFGKATR